MKDLETDVFVGVDPRRLDGGDLQTVFDQLGATKSFWGGVNAEVILGRGERKEIDKAVKDAIEILGVNNGLILSAMIFPETPRESIMYMIDSWKKHR